MKKVLVTGATGFIGSHVINELLEKDYNVVATSTSREKAMTANWYNKVEYIPLDLKTLVTDVDYYSFLDKPDLLIHLAWEGLPNYKSAFSPGRKPTQALFFFGESCATWTEATLLVTGTCFEYGMQEGRLSEDMPTSSHLTLMPWRKINCGLLKTEPCEVKSHLF